MPAVGDLQGVRGGFLDGAGVGGGPVAADDLDAGVGGEPGREGLGGAVGQDIDGTAGFDVDQEGAVSATAAEGELIDPQHPRCPFGNLRGFEQFQQPAAARGQMQLAAEPFAGPAAELDGDSPQPLLQSEAGASISLAQPVDLLDEGTALA